MSDPWDVLVVGGGVVGAAIAREFAASGKRVLVCEKEDEVASISFQNTKGLNFWIETEQTQVLGGASGANTGHFASFFYYTRARALLEGELAAQVEEMLFMDYFLFWKTFFSRRGKSTRVGSQVSRLCRDSTQVLFGNFENLERF